MFKKFWSVCAISFFAVAGFVSATQPVYAQVDQAPLDEVVPDHLKCYAIRDFNQVQRHAVELFTRQFKSFEKCKLATRAKFICAETAKLSVDGNLVRPEFPEAGDFLCYSVRCKDDGFEPEDRVIGVKDQFGLRRIRIAKAQMLCAPARKILPTQ